MRPPVSGPSGGITSGFTPDGTAELHRNGYQVVMVAVNRDLSPTETDLTIAVSRD
jgi:hypothetical protein